MKLIKAKDLKPGMNICYSGTRHQDSVYSVQTAKKNEIKVRINADSGTCFFDAEDKLWIEEVPQVKSRAERAIDLLSALQRIANHKVTPENVYASATFMQDVAEHAIKEWSGTP